MPSNRANTRYMDLNICITICLVLVCCAAQGQPASPSYNISVPLNKESVRNAHEVSDNLAFYKKDASMQNGHKTGVHLIDKTAVLPSGVTSGSFSTNYNTVVNAQSPLLYVFNFAPTDENNAIRVEVSSTCATDDYPILFATRQREDILAWSVPFNDYKAGKRVLRPKQKSCQKRGYYMSVGRTLCPEHIVNRQRNNNTNNTNYNREILVEVTSKSPSNLKFNLSVSILEDFELRHNETTTIQMAAAKPKYYMYAFPDDTDDLVVRFKSNSSTCMTVSIQDIRCPVLDMERSIEFEGKHQTMTKQATMFLERKNYNQNGIYGFYLVFVVHSTDEECTDEVSSVVNGDRSKVLSVEMSKGLSTSQYATAISVTVVVFIVFGIILCILLEFECVYQSCGFVNEDYPSVDDGIKPRVKTPNSTQDGGNDRSSGSVNNAFDAGVSDTQIHVVVQVATNTQKEEKPVSDLSTQKHENYYCRSLLSVAIFYGLPAIQLVITYHKVLRDSGDENLCYYNFACANPAAGLDSFNNVFSNIGYVLMGIAFILIVWRRKVHHAKAISNNKDLGEAGIPQDYGMFCALGFALIMEGVMSGTYHVCPNSFNFQFDTSFMYLIACLAIIKVYQHRHSDIVPLTFKFYLYVACYILLSVLLMLYHSTFLWVVYALFHAFCTLVFLVRYLGMGEWRIFPCTSDDNNAEKVILSEEGWESFPCFENIKDCRIVFPIIVGAINCVCALVFAIIQPEGVSIYFLYIFVGNLLVYCGFYVCRKCKCKCECWCSALSPFVFVLMIVILILWGISLYCFKQHASEWGETPAVSREHNKGCIVMDFYDIHDVWHFLSAISLFLSFMLLLILDDDVSTVVRTQLEVI